jgi:UPF0716 family protein affecting phage T7 exclusion
VLNPVFLLAVLAGAGIAVQLPMTAVIGQRIGLAQALFLVTLTGLFTLALVLVLGEDTASAAGDPSRGSWFSPARSGSARWARSPSRSPGSESLPRWP